METPVHVQEESLPSIRAPVRSKFIVTISDGEHDLRGGRSRSRSIGNEEQPKSRPTSANLLQSVVPNTAVASYTDGKLEIEKAYQMVRMVRKENEEYHRDLIKEREMISKQQLLIRELEMKNHSIAEEKKKFTDALESNDTKMRELQEKLAEERKKGAEKLETVISREKNLEAELARALKITDTLNGQLNALINRVSFKAGVQDVTPQIEAPIGRMALVFTDVESSTEKWERSPELMQKCLGMHNELIRAKIKQFDGYEVKTEGDSFMIAFQVPAQAARFMITLQLELIDIDWPAVTSLQ